MKYKKFELKITNVKNKEIVDQCEMIALENHISNGGTLRYLNLVSNASDYVLYCTYDNKVIGFIALTENFLINNDIYLMQIAVKKQFQKMGIGTALIKYLKSHSKQYKYITSNVRKDNIASQKLHEKNKFKKMKDIGNEYIYCFKSKMIFNKKLNTENQF